MAKKSIPPIRNWSEYNNFLINRGNITLWLSEDAIEKWYDKTLKKRGRPKTYSDDAILCALIIRSVFRLALRETQGFIESLIVLMGLAVKCPHYSVFSRRARKLEIPMPKISKEVVDIVCDGSGIKFYGPGEWLMRKHGPSKRRKWRKVHIVLDPKSQKILVAGLTTQEISDCKVLPSLLDGYKGQIGKVICDGAYDTVDCYQAIFNRGAQAVIPPRKGARSQKKNCSALEVRDKAIDRISRQKRGKKRWKEEVGYHRRSLGETAFSRLKKRMGNRLSSRLFENQAVEMFVRVAALNRMTELGMPRRSETAA